jgi:hypothetical protein
LVPSDQPINKVDTITRANGINSIKRECSDCWLTPESQEMIDRSPKTDEDKEQVRRVSAFKMCNFFFISAHFCTLKFRPPLCQTAKERQVQTVAMLDLEITDPSVPEVRVTDEAKSSVTRYPHISVGQNISSEALC